MVVFIGAIKNEDADLKKLSIQELNILKSKLFGRALKQMPNSTTQNKTKSKIEKIFTELNKRQKQ
jgi:hypothetical protein